MMTRANPMDLVSPDTIVTETMVKGSTAAMTLRIIGVRADDSPFDETIVLSNKQIGILIDVIQDGRVDLKVNCKEMNLNLL